MLGGLSSELSKYEQDNKENEFVSIRHFVAIGCRSIVNIISLSGSKAYYAIISRYSLNPETREIKFIADVGSKQACKGVGGSTELLRQQVPRTAENMEKVLTLENFVALQEDRTMKLQTTGTTIKKSLRDMSLRTVDNSRQIRFTMLGLR